MKKRYFVDIPNWMKMGTENSGEWENVDNFETKEAAIEYIQKHIDPASTNGYINLISEIQEDDEEDL